HFIEAQRLRNRPRDLRHFQNMGQACPVMIALGREEHLRLVLQPAKGLAMDDAVAVALIRRPDVVLRLRAVAPARFRAPRRARRERLVLDALEHFADGRQSASSKNRVPSIGLYRYGSMSTKPSDSYNRIAPCIVGSVSSRIARYPRRRASSMMRSASARPILCSRNCGRT